MPKIGGQELKGAVMEDFLNAKLVSKRAPKDRPLFGLTLLLVDDSRYFSEAVRLLAVRSGARLRRADCLASARKHLRIYNPDVILVDLGLPDGSGVEVIGELSELGPGGPEIVALSGIDDPLERQRALQAGAKRFLTKPLQDLAAFQQIINVVLAGDGAQKWQPGVVGQAVSPDPAALIEDLRSIRQLLRRALPDGNLDQIAYCASFLRSVARSAQDRELQTVARCLSSETALKCGWQSTGQDTLGLLDTRIATAPVI